MRVNFFFGLGAALSLALAGCGGKVVVDASSAGAGGGSGNGGAGQGGSAPLGCGGPLVSCQADEYCDYPDDACGLGSAGVCTKRPPFCDDGGPAQPVCGCNGKVYSYPCDAMLAGQDRGPNTGCPVESGFFNCGPIQVCDGTQSYCQRSVSDVAGEPDGWACVPFPACGGQIGCSCVSMEPCGSFCSIDASNHITLTCPGG